MTFNPILPVTIVTIITIILLIYILIFNRKDVVGIIIVILIFTINLKPTITNRKYENYNILFVLDTTYSMNTKDNNIRRIDQAKEDIKYIIDNINYENISIVTFNNTTNIILPFTNDKYYIKNTLNNINTIEKEYANGTSLSTSLDEINNYLENNNKIVMFYLSDGEDTKEKQKYNYSNIKRNLINGAILGYGTIKGNYIDENNISKLNEDSLKDISKKLDIDYIHTSNKTLINNKINTINRKKKTSIEIYQILLILLISLLTIEFNVYRRFLWKKY